MSLQTKRYKSVPLMVMNSGFLTPGQICLWIEAFAHSAEGMLICRDTGVPMLCWTVGTRFIKQVPKCSREWNYLTYNIEHNTDPKDGYDC